MDIRKLINYLPRQAEWELEEQQLGWKIVNVNTEEQSGVVDITEEGTFVGFDLYQIPETDAASISFEKQLERADAFAADFFTAPVIRTRVEKNHAIITAVYEQTDKLYSLPIPDSGITIEADQTGAILSAQTGTTAFDLLSRKITVTEEGAKQILSDQMKLTLTAIENKLYYQLHPAIAGVTVEGFFAADQERLLLTPAAPLKEHQSWQQLLGINDELVCYYQDENTMLWTEKGIAEQAADLEEIADLVMYTENDQVRFYSSAVPWTDEQRFDEAYCRGKAAAFLEEITGEVAANYWLESVQPSADHEEDETFEPALIFSFVRRKSDAALYQFRTNIHVGIHTGIIRECMEDKFPYADKHIKNAAEAQEILLDHMELTLSWVNAGDNLQGEKAYELLYVPAGAGGSREILLIDAESGNVEIQ